MCSHKAQNGEIYIEINAIGKCIFFERTGKK
jgi:hypothetical protein